MEAQGATPQMGTDQDGAWDDPDAGELMADGMRGRTDNQGQEYEAGDHDAEDDFFDFEEEEVVVEGD